MMTMVFTNEEAPKMVAYFNSFYKNIYPKKSGKLAKLIKFKDIEPTPSKAWPYFGIIMPEYKSLFNEVVKDINHRIKSIEVEVDELKQEAFVIVEY